MYNVDHNACNRFASGWTSAGQCEFPIVHLYNVCEIVRIAWGRIYKVILILSIDIAEQGRPRIDWVIVRDGDNVRPIWQFDAPRSSLY